MIPPEAAATIVLTMGRSQTAVMVCKDGEVWICILHDHLVGAGAFGLGLWLVAAAINGFWRKVR